MPRIEGKKVSGEVICCAEAYALKQGETDMGDTGKKDKGKREVQKKAKLTLMEKRKQKNEKKAK